MYAMMRVITPNSSRTTLGDARMTRASHSASPARHGDEGEGLTTLQGCVILSPMEIQFKNKRVLSVFTLVMINVIAIDSLRNLPANAATGLYIVFYYVIATLTFLLPCILVTAELATHHPKTGGAYVWVREAFGRKWGFFTIWMQWIYNVFWYPTILSFIAVNIAYLIDPALASNKLYLVGMIIALFITASIANNFGMHVSGWVSAISAIGGTLIPMIFIVILGVVWWCTGKPLAITPSWSNMMPSFTHPDNIALLVVVFFSLMGFEMSAVHAGEVKNPQRDYPRALLISSLVVVTSMILASIAITLVVPQKSLNIISGLDQAFSLFLNAFHLKWLMPITIVLIILGGFGGMAAWVIGPTKGLMVAAEDGCLPKKLSERNQYNAPGMILLLQAIVVVLISGLFLFFPAVTTSYWILSDLTAQMALIFYILFFACAIRLRYTTPHNPAAFRIPGGKLGLWVTCLVGILSCVGAIAIGFVPPTSIPVDSVLHYELILGGGLLIFILIPFVIYALMQKKKPCCHSAP